MTDRAAMTVADSLLYSAKCQLANATATILVPITQHSRLRADLYLDGFARATDCKPDRRLCWLSRGAYFLNRGSAARTKFRAFSAKRMAALSQT